MAEPFLAEIRMVSFGFPPRGWALCNGQFLPINQNQALFSLLGTTYGGNGTTNFALPNFQGRSPIHFGAGFSLGQVAGEENHTLTSVEHQHTHTVVASSNQANQASPASGYFSSVSSASFSSTPNTSMAPQTVSSTGGGQAHPNMSPYSVLSFVIALQGIFPSQN